MTPADLWSHHRAALLVLSSLGGAAQFWLLMRELRLSGEYAADLDSTVRELVWRGWVHLQCAGRGERWVTLTGAGRNLIRAVKAAPADHRS